MMRHFRVSGAKCRNLNSHRRGRFLPSAVVALCMLLPAGARSGEFDWLRAAQGGIKTYQAMTLSDKEVSDYVRQAVAYMDKQNNVLGASSPYTKRLQRLTAGLTKVNGIPLNFKVYRTNEYNAFACADGSVRVYSALMDAMSDDELLGVIGHEIGHVGLHHSRKAMKRELLTGALRDVISSSDSKMGVLASSALGSIGESLMNAKYSRSQEKEADDYGYDFLKKHGKNPWVLVMAFEKLDAASGKSKSMSKYFTQMFSTHPEMKTRIERISNKCKKDGFKRPAKK